MIEYLAYAVTKQIISMQMGLAVGSIGLSAVVLFTSVQTAHAVTPEQLLFLEVGALQCCLSVQ